jgi:hypothetical protein
MPTGTPVTSPTTAYATLSDLADYTGIALASLPDDAQRMLDRASEELDVWTQGRIDTDDDDHVAAALTAACAQVEMWMEMGEDSAWRGPLSSRTVGRVSETFAAGAGGMTSLAPRAHRSLMLAGLLYRGAGIR